LKADVSSVSPSVSADSLRTYSHVGLFVDKSDSKPEIIKHPEGHKVLLGQNVTLQCVVTQKNQTIRVNWTKNNKPLKGSHIITHTQVMEKPTFNSVVCFSTVNPK